jgi:transposase InsO family protein
MSAWTEVQTSSVVEYDGSTWQMVKWSPQAALLRRLDDGEEQWVQLSELLTHSTFRVVDDEPETGFRLPRHAWPEHVQAQVEARIAHVHEINTGFQSGDPDDALPHEPRPEYEPGRSVNKKIRSKVRELKEHPDAAGRASVATINRWRAAVRDRQVEDLADKRKLRSGETKIDQRVHDAMRCVAVDAVDGTNINCREARRRTMAILDREADGLAVPSERAFNKAWNELARRHDLNGHAGRRGANKNRPAPPYDGFTVTRFGELVQIDVNYLDVLAWNLDTGKVVRPRLVMAVDAGTGAIVAFRVVGGEVNAFDVGLVVFDMVSGAAHSKFPHAGVGFPAIPTEIQVADMPEPPAPIEVLGVVPDTIITDNGKEFRSALFEQVCDRFGINILRSRSRRPVDKAYIERTFGTLAQLLRPDPGWIGRDHTERAPKIVASRLSSIEEIAAKIAAWVQLRNRTMNRGRRLFGSHRPATPLELVHASVLAAGRVVVPVSQAEILHVLPTVTRKIGWSGVLNSGLTYDSEALNQYRNQRSNLPGRNGGWVFSYDPGDLRHLFFQDPRGTWHKVPARGAGIEAMRPFSDVLLKTTKRALVDRSANHPLTTDDVLRAITRITEQAHEARVSGMSIGQLELNGRPVLDTDVATAPKRTPKVKKLLRRNTSGPVQVGREFPEEAA